MGSDGVGGIFGGSAKVEGGSVGGGGSVGVGGGVVGFVVRSMGVLNSGE